MVWRWEAADSRFSRKSDVENDERMVRPVDLTAQESASAIDLSDTVSLLSEGPEARTVEVFEVRPSAYTTAVFAGLDLISARDVFGQRVCIMKVHPAFVRGTFRCAMCLALQEINTGMESHDTAKVSRGWKLLHLPPPPPPAQACERQGPKEEVT